MGQKKKVDRENDWRTVKMTIIKPSLSNGPQLARKSLSREDEDL
jgi:hypothetical protein